MGTGLGEKQKYVTKAFRQANVLNVFEVSELLWRKKLREAGKPPPVGNPMTLGSSKDIRNISGVYRVMASLVKRGLVAYPAKVRPREWYLAEWDGDQLSISLDVNRKAAWVWVHNNGLHIRCKGKWWLLDF